MSVPVLIFIDGFGLYRNTQRSLMGIYDIMASMNAQDRNRRQNVLPITIGPHGSNLENVIIALQSLVSLDESLPLIVNSVETTVCVFTLAYIGDMVRVASQVIVSAQNANSSFSLSNNGMQASSLRGLSGAADAALFMKTNEAISSSIFLIMVDTTTR